MYVQRERESATSQTYTQMLLRKIQYFSEECWGLLGPPVKETSVVILESSSREGRHICEVHFHTRCGQNCMKSELHHGSKSRHFLSLSLCMPILETLFPNQVTSILLYTTDLNPPTTSSKHAHTCLRNAVT